MKGILTALGVVAMTMNMYGTVYIIGDSTASDYSPERAPRVGWGQVLKEYSKGMEVKNFAVSGRSSKSFKDEGYWDKVENSLSDGDYVLIQFGHNDEKKEDPARYTSTNGTYEEHLKYYVEASRGKGAIPILLTSIHRRKFENGRLVDTHKEYLKSVEQVSKVIDVDFIDMAKRTEELLNTIGEERSAKLFMNLEPGESENYPNGSKDNTHLSEFGGHEIVKILVGEIKNLNIPLGDEFKSEI